MTGGGSSIAEVQRLLGVLATGRRVGEAGTAFGEGAEAMARTARSVITVELDPERATVAAERLAPYSNVELLVGDWRELLPRRGPYGLVFLDGGGFKHAPEESSDLVVGLLEHGGLLVMDDLTPGWPGFDPIRAWAHGHSGLRAVEVLTTTATSALLVPESDPSRAAVAAGAAEDDVVCGDLIATAARDSLEGLLESGVLERLHLAAVVADEVVVMITSWVDALEAGDPVAQVDALHQAELVETVERAVHARNPDLRPLRARAVVDLLSGETAVLAAEQLDDDAAGAAAAPAFGAHPIEHMIGPRFGHRR